MVKTRDAHKDDDHIEKMAKRVYEKVVMWVLSPVGFKPENDLC